MSIWLIFVDSCFCRIHKSTRKRGGEKKMSAFAVIAACGSDWFCIGGTMFP